MVMNRIFEYTISPTDAPCTVGEFLKQKGYSRQIIIHLKKTENGILRNGVWAYVRTQLFPENNSCRGKCIGKYSSSSHRTGNCLRR